jgi:hypothetical protein
MKFYRFIKHFKFLDDLTTFQIFPTNFSQLSTQLGPTRSPIRNFNVFDNKCYFFLFHMTNFIEIYKILSIFSRKVSN